MCEHKDSQEYTLNAESPAGKKGKLVFRYCGDCDTFYDPRS